MKQLAQDIRDAFAERNVDALDEALQRLQRVHEIREREIQQLRVQARQARARSGKEDWRA